MIDLHSFETTFSQCDETSVICAIRSHAKSVKRTCNFLSFILSRGSAVAVRQFPPLVTKLISRRAEVERQQKAKEREKRERNDDDDDEPHKKKFPPSACLLYAWTVVSRQPHAAWILIHGETINRWPNNRARVSATQRAPTASENKKMPPSLSSRLSLSLSAREH